MRVLIKVLVVMAMLLAVANAQCLARCGTEPCGGARPVPHCHEDPDSTPAASCPHPHFALASAAGPAPVTLERAETVVPAAMTVSLLNGTERSAAVSGDPPDIECPRLCVLKI